MLEDLTTFALTVFFGFFAIMNPIANTPVFLGLTAEDPEPVRRSVARTAVLLAFVIVVIFCVAGKAIFALFGITLPAFRIAGGIVVFVIGYHMLQGEPSRVHNPTHEDNRSSLEAELGIAVSPLAVPILAGPGTITTAMSFVATGGIARFLITIGIFGALCLITYAFFVGGQRVVEYIGTGGTKVVTRLMGLILTVVGVQMVILGLQGAKQLPGA